MQKIFKVSNVKFLFSLLLIFTALILFYQKPVMVDTNNIKLNSNILSVVELDLQSYLLYNNPSISIFDDYKNLFEGRYTHSVYSLHKFNLLISFLFLLIPVLLIFFIFLILGVSFRMTLLVAFFFVIFTVFPILMF